MPGSGPCVGPGIGAAEGLTDAASHPPSDDVAPQAELLSTARANMERAVAELEQPRERVRQVGR